MHNKNEHKINGYIRYTFLGYLRIFVIILACDKDFTNYKGSFIVMEYIHYYLIANTRIFLKMIKDANTLAYFTSGDVALEAMLIMLKQFYTIHLNLHCSIDITSKSISILHEVLL